jgi:hypothetical protein
MSAAVPDGFEPTEVENLYEFNPDGYVRTPEEQAIVDAALSASRELESVPADERPRVADPAKYADPIGMLTDDEVSERLRRQETEPGA